MKHGSLESGIGMFDYAAEQIGWENVFHCEINEFCRTVLNYYWPKSKSYANVFGFNGNEWRGKVDLITCGFPCQPFSHAGKREGTKDDRFIWPENMRIIREAKPVFVVAENVPGLITIEDGMVFEQVCLDLENEGYEITPLIIPAVATDKDHRRDRIWIVAHNNAAGKRRNEWQSEDEGNDAAASNNKKLKQRKQTIGGLRPELAANTPSERLEGGRQQRHDERQIGLHDRKETWIEAATRLCVLDDGNAGRLDTTSISKSRWRTESLKAAGNTIIWEIAYNIFRVMEEININNKTYSTFN